MALISAMLVACSPLSGVEERKDWTFSPLSGSLEELSFFARLFGSSIFIGPDERTVAVVSLDEDPFAPISGGAILFLDAQCLSTLGADSHYEAHARCITHAVTGPVQARGATWIGPNRFLVMDGGGTPTLIELGEGGKGHVGRLVHAAGMAKYGDFSLRSSSPELWPQDGGATEVVETLRTCLATVKNAAGEGRRVQANISGRLCGGIIAHDGKTEAVWSWMGANGKWAKDVERAVLPTSRFHWNDAEVFDSSSGIEVWGQNSIFKILDTSYFEVPLAYQAPVWDSRGRLTHRITADHICNNSVDCAPLTSEEIPRDGYTASAVYSSSANAFFGVACGSSASCTVRIFDNSTVKSTSGSRGAVILGYSSAVGVAEAAKRPGDDWDLPVHIYRGVGSFQTLVYLQGGPGGGGRAGLKWDQFEALRAVSREILVPQYSGARGISIRHYERLRAGLASLDRDMEVFCKMLADSGRTKGFGRIPVIAASFGAQAALSLLKTPCARHVQIVFQAPAFRLPSRFSMLTDGEERGAWRMDWNAAWVRFSFGVDSDPEDFKKLTKDFDSRLAALDLCYQCGLVLGEADNVIDNLDVCRALAYFPHFLMLAHQTHTGASFSSEAVSFTREVFNLTAKTVDARDAAVMLGCK